jgi:hypothetical protein
MDRVELAPGSASGFDVINATMNQIPHTVVKTTPPFWSRNLTAVTNDHGVMPELVIQDHTCDGLFLSRVS